MSGPEYAKALLRETARADREFARSERLAAALIDVMGRHAGGVDNCDCNGCHGGRDALRGMPRRRSRGSGGEGT